MVGIRINALVTALPGLVIIFVLAGGVNALAGVSFSLESRIHNNLFKFYYFFIALDCDFESDELCGFTFDLSAEFNWTRSNYTYSKDTGPSSDHTHGDGKPVICVCGYITRH